MKRYLLESLAVLAAKVNGFSYEMAVKANRLQGWAMRHSRA